MTIILATAGLLVLLIVGFIAVAAIRRYYREDDGGAVGGPPFTLHQLRQLRRDGEINEQQFQKLREQIIGAVASSQADNEDQAGDAGADSSGRLNASPPRPPHRPPDKQGGESTGSGG